MHEFKLFIYYERGINLNRVCCYGKNLLFTSIFHDSVGDHYKSIIMLTDSF